MKTCKELLEMFLEDIQLINGISQSTDNQAWVRAWSIYEWFKEEAGICDNLNDLAFFVNNDEYIGDTRASRIILKHFDSWEHFSGDLGYPIHDKDREGNPEDQFYKLGNSKWDGYALEMRISLLKHLISKVEV